MASIIFIPQYIGNGNVSFCNENMSDTSNHSGYQIALYVHAGAYIVNLAFDRYISSFFN